jgi:hypothetical protein
MEHRERIFNMEAQRHTSESRINLIRPREGFTSGETFYGFEPFVGPEVAAEFVKLSTRRLKEMARAGTVPAHPVEPNAMRKEWRFLLSELDEWMRRKSRNTF